jgi:hypothetical protein
MARPRRQLLAALALVAATVVTGIGAAGCGGDADAQQPPDNVPVSPATIPRAEVQRQLGTAFSDGLERLAVMSQPQDDAADLGQDLPTGLLSRVTCASPEACTVHWRTVDGKPRGTAYRIRAFRGACLTAAADPQLPNTWDSSIKTTSENPLNSLVGTGRGCP